MTTLQIWILSGVGAYIAFILGIGWWASRRIKSDKDYIVAGGQLGWWLSIGTIFATWFGAETCMGSSGAAFQKGLLGVIADPFGAGLCLILSGVFFAKKFRERNYETVVDFFEDRYGGGISWFLCLLYIPVYLGWIGAQLLAFGFILNSLTGFPLVTSVVIATSVVLVYTYLGGMWADTMADFFQMIILITGLLIIFPVLVKDLGGFANISARIPEEFFYFYPRGAGALDWLNYLQAWMIVGIGSLPAQDLFSRTMAAKSPFVARWASIISGLLYVVIGLLPVLIGIFARLAMPENSGEKILVDVALKYLSPPLIAVTLGALLAAIMSSADSAILAPSSIIGHNIVPMVRRGASEGLKLAWCKASVPVIGLLSLGMALYFKNIYRLCQEAWGILLVGIAAPLILGVYWKGADARGAFAGACAGVAAWISVKVLLPAWPSNLIGFAVSCLVVVVVSLFPKRTVQNI